MSGHFTHEAEKAVLRRKAVVNRFNSLYGEMEDLEKEVLKSMPEATSIVEAIQLVCTHLMNGNIDIEASLYENLPEQNRIEETTLKQLLDVLTMIKSCGPRSVEETRSATSFASSLIAKSYGIEKNTIYDIWVRRLGLPGQTRGFNELVFEWLTGKSDRLCQVVKAHVEEALHSKINDFFRA
jgi:hypothetical protein